MEDKEKLHLKNNESKNNTLVRVQQIYSTFNHFICYLFVNYFLRKTVQT